MRLLITRPRADAETLAERLLGLGHQVIIEPLLDIRYLDTAPDDVKRLQDGVQALLVTSANGVRAFAQCSPRRDLSVSAVGEASAQAAVTAGFDDVDSADGDVDALARRVIERRTPADGALLHVAGTKVAGDLAGQLEKAGFVVRRAVLYEAVMAHDLTPAVRADMAAGKIEGVLLFSPRTAENFVALVNRAGLADCCRQITAYCLSEAVAKKARQIDWGRLAVAARADQQSLIEAVEE